MTELFAPPPLRPEDIQPKSAGKTLGEIGLPELLPRPLAQDESFAALARAVEEEIRRLDALIPETLIWSRLDALEEPLLTHLAAWLHADLWDDAWSAEQKRSFLRGQIALHRKKGTAWAVETAIALVYGPSRISEWMEYGGQSGRFRLDLDILAAGLDRENITAILDMVEKYKRKSQHLDGVDFSLNAGARIHAAALAEAGLTLTMYPYVETEHEAENAPAVAAGQDLLGLVTFKQE
ncbi:MAG: phage tail protein I [Deltaproteobacteria bacterium]|jgi:phage tail P2-like protein|nr:phage tail protein I [Deltaproteobacteria bacterium]